MLSREAHSICNQWPFYSIISDVTDKSVPGLSVILVLPELRREADADGTGYFHRCFVGGGGV